MTSKTEDVPVKDIEIALRNLIHTEKSLIESATMEIKKPGTDEMDLSSISQSKKL